MTPKENRNENLPKLISGIFGKKFMGTHCNALDTTQTHTQAKNYSFSRNPTTDNCAENTLSIVSICETNSSSKSSIYQSM
jgi:hypothetical protein